MDSESILYINETKVCNLLQWDKTCDAVQEAMKYHYLKKTVQSARSITSVPDKVTLYAMPGYLNHPEFGALACKLVTNANNEHLDLPNVAANICLFDDVTGKLIAIIAGSEITAWRTAATSVVATKHIATKFNTCAILGAGVQGRIHAIAFFRFFKFGQVKIWNRNIDKANRLVEELNQSFKVNIFVVSKTVEECLFDADVIVTTTSSTKALVYPGMVKPGAHINAVGVSGGAVYEIAFDLHKLADIYIDHWEGANIELSGLLDNGITFIGEIGGVIDGSISVKQNARVTIFQSLGMAVQDCAVARMVYNCYIDSTPPENRLFQ